MPLDVLYKEFFGIQQGSESVTAYSTRLEAQVNKISEVSGHTGTSSMVQEQLLSHFFHNLCDPIRQAIRFVYKQPGVTYQQLLEEALAVQGEGV